MWRREHRTKTSWGALAALALAAASLVSGCEPAAPAVALSPQGLAGRAVYLDRSAPACGTCHRLADAGTRGGLGPDLDRLRPDYERVLQAVRDGIGVMPPQERVLSSEEIEAVARYVVEATGGLPAE